MEPKNDGLVGTSLLRIKLGLKAGFLSKGCMVPGSCILAWLGLKVWLMF